MAHKRTRVKFSLSEYLEEIQDELEERHKSDQEKGGILKTKAQPMSEDSEISYFFDAAYRLTV